MTRNYGLGAGQILEAEIMLSDGIVVIANHSENMDLVRAIHSGGPDYGVSFSRATRAHPDVDMVTVHHLALAPLKRTQINADLIDAAAVLMQ